MLVPLYEAAYDRLDVGSGSRLLGLGCGSGLALLMATARGAAVTGCEPDEQRLALARERLLPEPRWGAPATARARAARLLPGGPQLLPAATEPFTIVTVLDPAARSDVLAPALSAAARLCEPGTPVVLTGWGPSERCATHRILRVAGRLAEPRGPAGRLRLSGRDDLEDLALGAGLRPDGSGRVSCPFGYADMDSAVRGMLSTRLFDDAVAATDQEQVEKELAEALHAYRRPHGGVWMENVFRYLIARA